MSSFDPEALQLAEREFLASPDDDELLGRYYELMVSAGETLLRSHARGLGLIVSAEKRSEVAHDAFTRLLEYHRRHPGREIPAASRMFQEVRFQLHNPTVVRYEQRVGRLETSTSSAPVEDPGIVDGHIQGFVREIVDDQEVQGQRIVALLFTNRFYRTAVTQIAKFTPRPWIYRNAVKLHTVFKMTRRKFS